MDVIIASARKVPMGCMGWIYEQECIFFSSSLKILAVILGRDELQRYDDIKNLVERVINVHRH